MGHVCSDYVPRYIQQGIAEKEDSSSPSGLPVVPQARSAKVCSAGTGYGNQPGGLVYPIYTKHVTNNEGVNKGYKYRTGRSCHIWFVTEYVSNGRSGTVTHPSKTSLPYARSWLLHSIPYPQAVPKQIPCCCQLWPTKAPAASHHPGFCLAAARREDGRITATTKVSLKSCQHHNLCFHEYAKMPNIKDLNPKHLQFGN